MPKLDEVDGWVLIIGAAGWMSRSLATLVIARRRGTPHPKIRIQVWYDLFLGLAVLVGGLAALHVLRGTWPVWVAGAGGAIYLMARPVPGIMSRRKARLFWWHFWGSPDPAGASAPAPLAELDAKTAALIRRINTASLARSGSGQGMTSSR